MSKVKIETLTPVHIGSGNMLYKGMDYVVKDENLYVIDHKKVLDIIGADKVDAWVTSIDRGENIADFISRQGVKNSPTEYASRYMWCGKEYRTVKECIHDGRGFPYIPGSSIKGAIRSAVLATEVDGKENQLSALIGNGRNACRIVEEKVFSKEVHTSVKGVTASNTSCFRFLQVGDAYFKGGCETVLNAVNLNERSSTNELVDKKSSQAIEAIGYENETIFDMKLNGLVYAQDKSRILRVLPNSMVSLPALFKTINNHTKSLLEDELEYWLEKENDGFEGTASYIEFIESLIAETEEVIEGKECVLRIGYASGWRFTTGAWTENFNDFYSRVVPMSRPGNFKYADYAFPKSRRVYEIEGGEVDVLGFVKLTLI